jgi:hypothetical protein
MDDHDVLCGHFNTQTPIVGCHECEIIAQARADERHLIAGTWAASLIRAIESNIPLDPPWPTGPAR